MSDVMTISIAVTVCFVATLFAAAISCSQSSRYYYEAQQACIASGSTFISTGGDNRSICLHEH